MTEEEIIDYLKRYWKVDELKFIARFHIPINNKNELHKTFGFFDRFQNYNTGLPIYYPKHKLADDYDNRISFRHRVLEWLYNDSLYYLSLELDPNKNDENPFKLRITEVLPVDQEETKKHLSFAAEQFRNRNKDIKDSLFKDNRIGVNLFVGQYFQNNNGYGHLKNIMSINEGNLLLQDGRRQDVFIKVDDFPFLEEEAFYEFSFHSIKIKDDGTLLFYIDKNNPPKKLLLDPYKEIVRLRYERLNNPEANKMIANLMREIGKGLYSSKQRMIFELLQNADDAPSDESVQFHIDVSGDYFLVMHNGVPFNKDDVEAITSAAESTKRKDKKKTGYKGIGFKSVFTDSQEVIIQSGGFLFAFKRDYPVFNDFDTFYFDRERYKKYPELLEEDMSQYKKQRIGFNGYRDIPWQVIPIWQESIPDEMQDSNFDKFNNNVKIAIKFGSHNITGYLDAINDFVETPQFIIFLRNTNFFRSPKNGVTVSKKGINPINIRKTTASGIDIELQYFKHEIPDIPVTDDSLKELGVNIKKSSRKNDFGEITHFFVDETDKEIENIPPKLAELNETNISFGIPMVNNLLTAEKKYLKGVSYSSLFTYLPMEELRIQLPFLVNADFVPSSDRESVQGDNPWNGFLFALIAQEHVKLLEFLAHKFLEKPDSYGKYLSVLLKSELEDNHSAQYLIDKYNEIYLSKLKEAIFIVADTDEILSLNNIILDNSKVSEIFGDDFFYEITETKNFLPNSKLDKSFLYYNYLKIEQFKDSELIELLNKEDVIIKFKSNLISLSEENELEFIKWFNALCSKNTLESNWITSKPIVKIENERLTIKEALIKDNLFFLSEKTNDIESILEKVGFKFYSINFKIYQKIYEAALTEDSYLKNNSLLFKKIQEHSDFSKITIEEKNQLLHFLNNLDNIAERSCEKLQAFKTKENKESLSPLKNLISNNNENIPKWLQHLIIDPSEEKVLDEVFQKLLIKTKDWLEKIYCNEVLFNSVAEQLEPEDLSDFYGHLVLLEKELPKDITLTFNNIPWLYCAKEKKFKLPSEIYSPDNFSKLSDEDYQNVSKVIMEISEEDLPCYDALQILKPFKLGCKKDFIKTIYKTEGVFTLDEMKSFLKWVDEKDFLENFEITKDGENFILKKGHEARQFYTSNKDLISLIEESELSEKLKLFPKELYNEEITKIGLLDG